MNKAKRTLVISSIVMMLVLSITIVGVTVAWFSNYASSSSENPFIADSTTISESVSISIGDDAEDVNGYGTSIYPAISQKGYLEKGNTAPYGTELKATSEGQISAAASGKISASARCAVLYFSINCVGSPDKNASGAQIDGRKSLAIAVNSAKIDNAGIDYLSQFNVEMELVNIREDESGENKTAETIEVNSEPTANSIYYIQPKNELDARLTTDTLYMLVNPGDTYYVKATIYFNKVDEECLDKLIHFGLGDDGKAVQNITFTFEIKNKLDSSVDIRNNIY